MFSKYLTFATEYDAELINYEESILFKNNVLLTTVDYEIKINNRAGEKYININIPYSNSSNVFDIEASLYDENNSIIKKLKESEITSRSAYFNGAFYNDYAIYEFAMKHNVYPYILKYQYKIKQNEFLQLCNWTPILTAEIPTRNSKLKIELPKMYQIRYKNKFIDSFKLDSTAKSYIYTWTASYSTIVKEELYAPPVYDFLPNVQVLPLQFKYNVKGSYSNWKTYGDWESELIKGLTQLPEAEKAKINTILIGVCDTIAKIKKLYFYLQSNTRYVNVMIETGGMKPYPASYVSKNKFGDCKALTIYFKALLEYAGVKSYYTNVYAGSNIKYIDTSFPSQQFNHVILYIPLKHDTIWLDCTSKLAFNYLGTFSQNRSAFVVDSINSHFQDTPSLTENSVIGSRRINYELISNEVEAKATCIYRGEAYEQLFYIQKLNTKSEQLGFIQDNYTPKGLEIRDFNIGNFDRDSAKISLTYRATSKQTYKQFGNDLLINIDKISMPKFEQPANRKLPLQIDYPICYIDTIEYNIPDKYSITSLPINNEIIQKYGYFKNTIKVNNNIVVLRRELVIHSGNYSIDNYADFFQFIENITQIDKKNQIIANQN